MTPLIKESTVFNHCAHELAADVYTDLNVCSSKPHIHFFNGLLNIILQSTVGVPVCPFEFPSKDFNVITVRLVRALYMLYPHTSNNIPSPKPCVTFHNMLIFVLC